MRSRAIAEELQAGRDLDLDREVLAAMHARQRPAQLLRDGLDVDRRLAEQLAAARGGAMQLVLDDAVHAIDLAHR